MKPKVNTPVDVLDKLVDDAKTDRQTQGAVNPDLQVCDNYDLKISSLHRSAY